MIRQGTTVKWSWGNGTAEGTFTSKITKTIKGMKVTQNRKDPIVTHRLLENNIRMEE